MAHSSTVSASLLSFFIHFFHHLRSRVTPSQGLHSSTLPPSSCIYPRSSHLLVRIECTGLMALSFSALPCALPLQSGGVGILGRRQIPSSLSPSSLRLVFAMFCYIQYCKRQPSVVDELSGDGAGGKDDGRKTEGRRNPVQSGEEKKGQMSVKRGAPDSAALPLSDCPVSDRPTDGAG